MSQKQFMAHRPKAVRKPIPRPPVAVKNERADVGGKRPLPPTPALIQRAAQAPQSITPMEAVQLQRTIGNQALGRLTVQAKLTLGPVGDKYEQEADAVAKQVVGRLGNDEPPTAQRQEEDDELQMSPISTLQRQEDDEEELQMKPSSDVQRQEEEEEELQMKPISSVQRQEEEEELQMKPSSTLAGGELSGGIESQIQQAKGGGRPLSPQTQSSMSRAFNADFSGVNVHTDSQSDQLNRSIQARAFTTGQDIFFRQGEYNPNSSGGQELLAHELTHTIQQTGGGQAQRQPVVQRLINSRDFMINAGITKRKKSGEMSDLLHVLDRYNSLRPFISTKPTESLYTNLLILLTTVEQAANSWQNTTGSSWGVGRFFRKGAKTRHISKKTAVTTLLTEIATERKMLTVQKNSLVVQRPMLAALDENEARPDMVTSFLEQPLEATNAETLVQKLELSKQVIESQINEMLERKERGETISEAEVRAVGRSLQGLNVVSGQLFSIANSSSKTNAITGKFDESIRTALDAQVKGSDPKKLYEYAHLDRGVGIKTKSKDIRAMINAAVKQYLLKTNQEVTVGQHIGNTDEGKLIREGFMWLGNPVIKWLYDLFISDPTEFAKMGGLVEPKRVERLTQLFMQVPQLSIKAQKLPGAEKAFQLSGATFYALPTDEKI